MYKIHLSDLNRVKMYGMKNIKFYQYRTHLLTNLGEIRYLLSIREFCENQHMEGHIFLMGMNKIILIHVQWNCMTSESNESLVKVSVLCHGVYHMQPC